MAIKTNILSDSLGKSLGQIGAQIAKSAPAIKNPIVSTPYGNVKVPKGNSNNPVFNQPEHEKRVSGPRVSSTPRGNVGTPIPGNTVKYNTPTGTWTVGGIRQVVPYEQETTTEKSTYKVDPYDKSVRVAGAAASPRGYTPAPFTDPEAMSGGDYTDPNKPSTEETTPEAEESPEYDFDRHTLGAFITNKDDWDNIAMQYGFVNTDEDGNNTLISYEDAGENFENLTDEQVALALSGYLDLSNDTTKDIWANDVLSDEETLMWLLENGYLEDFGVDTANSDAWFNDEGQQTKAGTDTINAFIDAMMESSADEIMSDDALQAKYGWTGGVTGNLAGYYQFAPNAMNLIAQVTSGTYTTQEDLVAAIDELHGLGYSDDQMNKIGELLEKNQEAQSAYEEAKASGDPDAEEVANREAINASVDLQNAVYAPLAEMAYRDNLGDQANQYQQLQELGIDPSMSEAQIAEIAKEKGIDPWALGANYGGGLGGFGQIGGWYDVLGRYKDAGYASDLNLGDGGKLAYLSGNPEATTWDYGTDDIDGNPYSQVFNQMGTDGAYTDKKGNFDQSGWIDGVIAGDAEAMALLQAMVNAGGLMRTNNGYRAVNNGLGYTFS